MQTRLTFIVDESTNLKQKLHQKTEENRKLDRDLNSVKVEMLRLKKLRESKIA